MFSPGALFFWKNSIRYIYFDFLRSERNLDNEKKQTFTDIGINYVIMVVRMQLCESRRC